MKLKIMTVITILVIAVFSLIQESNAANLTDRLNGRILLQVESHGEAWYVNPTTGKRHYMRNGADAYQLMRKLGLGISNADFENFGNKTPQKLAGKILLKVEDHGKAFYVNPIDLKMHYLGNADDAYRVMKNLGLGIKNTDLDQININDNSETVAIPNQIPNEQDPGNNDSGSESDNCSNIREYSCPKLVEYEFTRPENLIGLSPFLTISGPPLLRLDYAEIQGDDMACVYEDSFATVDINTLDNEFMFILTSADNSCPNFLGLNIRNKDIIAPDWKILYPGYLKIDKTHAGHKYVAMNLYSSINEKLFSYDGCVYTKTIQSETNSTLRQVKKGFCIVNDSKDGFKCADSLAGMYGTTENNMAPINQ